MFRASLTALVLTGALAFGACADLPSEALELEAMRAPAPSSTSIAEIAINGGFSELVGALQYVDAELDAGFVNLFLNGTDQFTVFAPTNAAFEGLYTLLSAVLNTPIGDITDVPAPVVLAVLQYHVTTGRRAANSVVPPRADRVIETLLGETFAVRANGAIRDGLTPLAVRLDASITGPNNSARNGIVHVINQVIVPPSIVAALTQ